MKKVILTLVVLTFFAFNLYAQEGKMNLGVGVEDRTAYWRLE